MPFSGFTLVGMSETYPSKLRLDLGPVLFLNQIFGLFPYDLETLRVRYWSLIISISLPSSITIPLYINFSGGNRSNFDAFILALFRTLSIVPWITTSYFFLKCLFIRSDVATIMANITTVENRFRFKERPHGIFKSSFIYDFAFRYELF